MVRYNYYSGQLYILDGTAFCVQNKPSILEDRCKDEKNTIKIKTFCWYSFTNTGTVVGDEVVQFYIRDCVSSVTRPVKELKGFDRVTIEPDKTKTVSFEITPEHLSFYDINMDYVVEPGEFKIMVGNSSRDQDLQTALLTVEPDSKWERLVRN